MKMKKHAAGVLIGAALSTLSYQSYADVILHAFN
jgi:alpha-amylase